MSESSISKKTKQIIALALVAVVSILALVYFNYSQNDNIAQNNTESSQTEASKAQISEDGQIVAYGGVAGQNALVLLKSYTTVETEEFSGLGEYVVSINGLKADSNTNYWALYVNNEASQVGASEYTTNDTDNIEWRLEDVQTFNQ